MKYRLSVLLGLLVSVCSFSQNTPSLSKSSEIQTGSFPNGITYYLVTNKAKTGFADFAVIQRKASAPQEAASALRSLSRFQGSVPYRFLAEAGASYPENGFYSVCEGSGEFRFADVPTASDAVIDTTVMLLFDICSRNPAEQAVVVSGDIDASSLLGRMSVFSMMISSREKVAESTYEWRPYDYPQIGQSKIPTRGTTVLTASFASPRPDKKSLATVQNLVKESLFSQLGIIAQNRIRRAFRAENLPLGGVKCSYEGSDFGPRDEIFRIEAVVDDDRLFDATALFARALSDIGNGGATIEEVLDAKSEYLYSVDLKAKMSATTNSEYIDRCKAAYLYGTDLAPLSDVNRIISKKAVSPEVDFKLMNAFAASVLDPESKMSLDYRTPFQSYSSEELLSTFLEAWRSKKTIPLARNYVRSGADTISFAGTAKKVKLKGESEEPASGGTMWTFANGMKVIFKNTGNNSLFNYTFLLKGGFPDIPGYGAGEGAFASDLLSLYNVAGRDSESFNDILAANGITMERNVGISDLRITGTAPSRALTLVMRILISLANDRKLDADAVDYYRKCAELECDIEGSGLSGVLADVDELMRPDYAFSEFKDINNLKAGLEKRADSYFESRFSSANNGVIILSGDLDKASTLSMLCRYIGNFRTSQVNSVRLQQQYVQRSGTSIGGREVSDSNSRMVIVSMSELAPLSSEKYLALCVAKLVLEKELALRFSEFAANYKVSADIETIPADRLNITVSCRPVCSGLPEGVPAANQKQMLDAVLSCVSALGETALSKNDFEYYTSLLQKQMDLSYSSVEGMMDRVMTRYSNGRDLSLNYKEGLKTLTPETLRKLFSTLDNGCKVEFIVD